MSNFLQYLFDGAEIIGTIAFAASGAMIAIDRELDLFGVLFLGVIAAVGGGIMRDMIMGIVPPNAFTNSIFVAFAFVTSLIVFLYAFLRGKSYWRSKNEMDRVINLLDAVGLGIFSVIGAQLAMERGFENNSFLCIFMGMMTGVGGGVLRDLLSRSIPAVLIKRIYAVASLLGAGAYYAMVHVGAGEPAAMLVGMILTVVIRLLSTHYAWDLPKVTKV